MTFSPPMASNSLSMLSSKNFSLINKSDFCRVFLAISIVPNSLSFSRSKVVNLAIFSLTSLKDGLPLNFGPRTGRLGLASSLTYFSTYFSYLMSSTLISYLMQFKKGASCSNNSLSLLTMVNDMIGCLREIFFCSLSFLAVSMILITLLISSAILGLISF